MERVSLNRSYKYFNIQIPFKDPVVQQMVLFFSLSLSLFKFQFLWIKGVDSRFWPTERDGGEDDLLSPHDL